MMTVIFYPDSREDAIWFLHEHNAYPMMMTDD